MKNYDLIIVGAGFSGLACAESAARQNVKALVLERKPESGCRLHTTGIVVKDIAEQWNIPRNLTRRINGVRIYGPSLDWVDLSSPDYYFLATDTAGLLRWQAAQTIRAGARINYEQPYQTSCLVNHHHIFAKEQLRCRYLAGCDGARSRVAREYHLGENRYFLIGIEAEFDPLPDLDQNKLHVFIDSNLSHGYIGWIVPGVNCTQVGLATRFPHAPRLRDFLQKIASLHSLKNLTPFAHRAGVSPCGGIVKDFYHDQIMLLGDAAGMVSPVTAGGIHPAIQTGHLAGSAIADYLLHGGPNPGMLVNQNIPHYTFKKLLRYCTDHVHIPNTFYDLLLQTPLFRSVAQTLFFHKRGLLTVDAWRDIIRIFTH
jgi:flavin-dependent dehydrogenase